MFFLVLLTPLAWKTSVRGNEGVSWAKKIIHRQIVKSSFLDMLHFFFLLISVRCGAGVAIGNQRAEGPHNFLSCKSS